MPEPRKHGKYSELDIALARLDRSRMQLRGRFARSAGAGVGARVGARAGLGIASLLLAALLRRRARAGGVGLVLTLGLAAVQALRRKS